MNYKEYLKWGIFHIIFIIFLTIANYKVFGFEFTIMYLMLEIVSSIMGMRLELIKLLDKKIEEIKINYDEFYKHYNITTTINEEKCNSTIHSATDRIFCSKINEIIDYINKEGGNNA